jgi:hypothetical protein
MQIKKLLLLLLLAAGTNKIIQAQITWNFNSNVAAAGAPVNITGSNITQGNNNGGTGFRNNGLPASFGYAGASAAQNGNCSAKTGALNITPTGSTYVQTVLTPATNFWVNITAVKWGNFSLSTTGPTTLSVYASDDNFATATFVGSASVTYSTTAWTLVNPTVTPYSGLTGTAVTVRIFASGGTGTTPGAGTANWRIDDLIINATAQTGSAGQIPKYTSPTTFANSIITENSGQIGIGIATPAQKLDVAGGIKFSGLLVTSQVSNPAGVAGQVLQSNGPVNPPSWANLPVAPVSSWDLSGNALAPASTSFLGTTTNNDLVFKVNNTESGRLGSANNNTSFGFSSAINNTGDFVTAMGRGAAQDNTGLLITASGNNAAKSNTGTGITAVGVASAFGNTGNNVSALGVSAAGNGNTGNNITATGYAAAAVNTGNDVVANGMDAAYANAGNKVTAIGNNAGNNNTGSDVTALGFKAAYSNIRNNVTAIGAYATVTIDNAISLGGINGINGATADVNVGIGTTAPTEKLHIQNGKIRMADGTQGFGKVLTSDANGVASWADAPVPPSTGWDLSGNTGTDPANNFIGTTDEIDLVFRVNNTESGRIGNDLSNPNTSLGLGSADNNLGLATTTIGGYAGAYNSGYGLSAIGLGSGNQNTGVFLAASGYQAGLQNSGGYLVANGAYSGIGNTGQNVTVNGANAGQSNTGDYATFTGAFSGNYNTGNNVTATGFSAANNSSGNNLTANGALAGYTNSGSDVTAMGANASQYNSGNRVAAIGFNASQYNRGNDVTAIGYNTAQFNLKNNVTAIGAYATVTVDNAISLGSINGINGATADVKVGIGTTAPSEKLHIQNGTIRIVDGTEGAGKILTSDANGVASWQPAAFAKNAVLADNGLILNGNTVSLGSALNQHTAITSNGFGLSIRGSKATTTFTGDGNLFSSGKIAIGTTDLAQIGNYSLAVNGSAIFTKASVKLIGNWPDYVFEPAYKLSTLTEVENFLKENKHLPGVPSAAEIQKHGIDLGDNQTVLLKKVEELTLYAIEANKKIELQQAQIDVLLKQQQQITELQEALKKIKNK